jgi:hypothetical protein
MRTVLFSGGAGMLKYSFGHADRVVRQNSKGNRFRGVGIPFGVERDRHRFVPETRVTLPWALSDSRV